MNEAVSVLDPETASSAAPEAEPRPGADPPGQSGHTRWVRAAHWIGAISFLTLAATGFMILMVHPRLYWGDAGNDLTRALVELPISRNYRHGGWTNSTAFYAAPGSPVSASRTYDIFNKNGWGRSLHFLAAWIFVLTGAVYLLTGLATGHFRRNIVPRRRELSLAHVRREIVDHLHMRIPPSAGGPRYGLLQKSSYLGIVFFALPLTLVSGLAMSPAITAAYPFLSDVFGGHQSARTIHFAAFVALILFLLVHVLMVVKSGLRAQMRAMTLGGRDGR